MSETEQKIYDAIISDMRNNVDISIIARNPETGEKIKLPTNEIGVSFKLKGEKTEKEIWLHPKYFWELTRNNKSV